MIREFSNAALETAREKALNKTQEFLGKLEPGLSDTEKFQRLCNEWELIRACSARCGDNFDPELYIERKNYEKSPENLEIIMRSYAESFYRLAYLTQAMSQLDCTKINGTSVAFAQCAKGVQTIEINLDRALKVYKTGPFSLGEVIEEAPSLAA